MLDTLKLRKSKIKFIDNNKNILKSDYFDKLINQENISLDEKWFLRGCKQIVERHYTEAIKRFQLSNSDDSKILILACSFKIADKFLFEEYYTEDIENFIYFPKYKFQPFFVLENQKYEINSAFIKNLKNSL